MDEPIIRNIDEVESMAVPRSEGATIKVLLGEKEKMPNFYTRIFTLEPGAKIPKHVHDTIEHQQVMLEGTMVLTINDKPYTVVPGNVMYIPKKASHSYENAGETQVRFVCVIPSAIEYTTDFLD